MYTCPHCSQPAITPLRKAILGPGAPVTCKACGEPVGIGFSEWLKAAAPGAIVMTAAAFLDSTAWMYGLSAVGLVLMIGMHLARVPLVKA